MNRWFAVLLSILLTQVSFADEHIGHSDDLLLLLKDKIALQKHLNQPPAPNSEQARHHQLQQHRLLLRALTRLQHYVAISENQYPNMDIYHQSLKSRAALMQDFANLMLQIQCLQEQACEAN